MLFTVLVKKTRGFESVAQFQPDMQADVETWLADHDRATKPAFLSGIPELKIIRLVKNLGVAIASVGALPETRPDRFSHVSQFMIDQARCSTLVTRSD